MTYSGLLPWDLVLFHQSKVKITTQILLVIVLMVMMTGIKDCNETHELFILIQLYKGTKLVPWAPRGQEGKISTNSSEASTSRHFYSLWYGNIHALTFPRSYLHDLQLSFCLCLSLTWFSRKKVPAEEHLFTVKGNLHLHVYILIYSFHKWKTLLRISWPRV